LSVNTSLKIFVFSVSLIFGKQTFFISSFSFG